MADVCAVECAWRATDDVLLGPDWALNFEICDILNMDPGQVKDVMKVLKKRLGSKTPRVQILVLIVLETLIKNCVEHVILQIVKCDILHDMVKIAKKKPDFNVREKILILMNTWKDCFGETGGKYPEYYDAYKELQSAGVGYPPDAGNTELLFMPYNRGVVCQETLTHKSSTQSDISALRDIESARGIAGMLMEMLNALDPCDSKGIKQEVIAYLVDQCRSYQKHVMLLVRDSGKEELLHQGLALNDELHHVLQQHDNILNGTSTTGIEIARVIPLVPINYNEDEPEDDAIQLTHWTSRNFGGQMKIRSIPKNGQLCDNSCLPPSSKKSSHDKNVDLYSSESSSSTYSSAQPLPAVSVFSTLSSRSSLTQPSTLHSQRSHNLPIQNSESIQERTSINPHDSLSATSLSTPSKRSQRKQLSWQKQQSHLDTSSAPQGEPRWKTQNQRLQQETSSSLQQPLCNSDDQDASSLTFDAKSEYDQRQRFSKQQQQHYLESSSSPYGEPNWKTQNQIPHQGKTSSSQQQPLCHSDVQDTSHLTRKGKWEDIMRQKFSKQQQSSLASKDAHNGEPRKGKWEDTQRQSFSKQQQQQPSLVSKDARYGKPRGKTRNQGLDQGKTSSTQQQQLYQSDGQDTTLFTRDSKSDSSSKNSLFKELAVFTKSKSQSASKIEKQKKPH